MVRLVQHSWLGGQLDTEMLGRQDLAKYRKGASVLKNFLPVKRGAIRKRPGSDILRWLTNGILTVTGAGTAQNPYVYPKFRLLPFAYTEGAGFVLLLKDGAAYAIKDDYGATTAVGGTSVPYTANELDDISYVQCGDILYLAHRNHPPAMIRHTLSGSSHVFAYSTIQLNAEGLPTPDIYYAKIRRNKIGRSYRGGETTDLYACSLVVEKDGGDYEGPLYKMEGNWTAGNIGANENDSSNYHKYGSETDESDRPTASESEGTFFTSWGGTTYYLPFTESQRIRLYVKFNSAYRVKQVRLYKKQGGSYGLIAVDSTGWNANTDTSAPTKVELEDSGMTPDTSVSPMEATTVFNAAGDYPGCVSLYQQRLVWASSANDPARIWMSATGDFYENRPHVIQQPDDPIDFILPITQFPKVNHVIELGRLFALCAGQEFVVGSNSDVAGLSYETIQATCQSYAGSSKRLPPVVANNSILFAEQTGQSVKDLSFDIAKNLYGGTDVSVLSSSIFADRRIVDWTWQQHPNATLWCVLSDGTLASLTYMSDQEVCAWAVHEVKDYKARAITKTCSIRGNAGDDPTTSTVVVALSRGNSILLARMRPWPKRDGDTVANMVAMDCVQSVASGGATPTGYIAVGKTDGALLVNESASGTARNVGADAWAGMRIAAEMTTVPPAISDEDIGAGQFDVKNVQSAALRVANAVGGTVKAVGVADAQASKLADSNSALSLTISGGKVLTPVTDVRCVLSGCNSRDGRVTVKTDEPWPFELVMLETDIAVESEEGPRR